MKIAELTTPRPMNPRHLTAALLVAVLVGCFAAWASCLGIYYHYRGRQRHDERLADRPGTLRV